MVGLLVLLDHTQMVAVDSTVDLDVGMKDLRILNLQAFESQQLEVVENQLEEAENQHLEDKGAVDILVDPIEFVVVGTEDIQYCMDCLDH